MRPATAPEHWDYPAEEKVAETLLHILIKTLLWQLVRRHLANEGVRAFTGSDQFVYWEPGQFRKAQAPDVYVVLGADPSLVPRVWKTWEDGTPALAIEIVSGDLQKDYTVGPIKYDEMGVRELVIIDPLAEEGPGRLRWQVYQAGERGLSLVEAHDGDRVWCETLGCHLRMVESEDGTPRVRLATGPDGDDLVLTAEEAERAARLAAEAEVAALRALLARRGD